ncbi:MAG: XdhC family protein [Mangrovicoccus sp.]
MNISRPQFSAKIPVSGDPITALLADHGPGCLLVIAGVEGASYRPQGAVMAVMADGQRVGSLSSGCIEADLVHQAQAALQEGRARKLRYGRGSPFIDLTLPCGGGLDIWVLPNPDRQILAALEAERRTRRSISLMITSQDGRLRLTTGPTERFEDELRIEFAPELRFLVFGKGPEASSFAAMAQAAGYDCRLYSPDAETLETAAAHHVITEILTRPHLPASAQIDVWTAVTLFFHDHDWEPPILAEALDQPALYIGAQGSLNARNLREAALLDLGIGAEHIERLQNPFGLIPSVRDPRSLAVSVLADVLNTAQQR